MIDDVLSAERPNTGTITALDPQRLSDIAGVPIAATHLNDLQQSILQIIEVSSGDGHTSDVRQSLRIECGDRSGIGALSAEDIVNHGLPRTSDGSLKVRTSLHNRVRLHNSFRDVQDLFRLV